MSIFGIFGKSNKNKWYNYLLNFYKYFSNIHHLFYYQENEAFMVMTMGRASPSGIQIHTSLSDKIYNVLIDQNFQHMVINREIYGIKIYKRYSHEQVTFYIHFHFIHGYKKLLHIFRAYGIHIEPKLQFHRDESGSYVMLNRMYIAKDIYVRYSTHFYDKLWGHPKIRDSTWKSAAEKGHPYIWAISRSYLLNHLYNLDYNSPHIITFLTLKDFNGIIVPIPNIILSLSSNKLKTYDIYEGNIEEYELFTKIDKISDHPEERLRAFLG